jgi:hypothetical protein
MLLTYLFSEDHWSCSTFEFLISTKFLAGGVKVTPDSQKAVLSKP